jgi:hypothetical protein
MGAFRLGNPRASLLRIAARARAARKRAARVRCIPLRSATPFTLAVSGRPAEHECLIVELSGLAAPEAMRIALRNDGKTKRDDEHEASA